MPNTFGLNRTLGGAIGAIALVSVLSSGAVLNALGQLHDATEARRRVVLVLRDLDVFRTAMLNQETGLRGFLITGRDSSLEPYRTGRSSIDDTASRLRSLVGSDAVPLRLLDEAITAARSWQMTIGEAAIRLAADPATRPDAVRIEAEGKGKEFFDTLREKLDAIEAVEEKNRLIQTEWPAAGFTDTWFRCDGEAGGAPCSVASSDVSSRLRRFDWFGNVVSVSRRPRAISMFTRRCCTGG